VVGRVAARITGDNHMVAGFQCVIVDAGLFELRGRCPFHRPSLHLTVFVRRLYVHERVRVPEHELHDVPFDLLSLVLEVRRGEGVMGARARRDEACSDGQDDDDTVLH